jgi:hypothetical protein
MRRHILACLAGYCVLSIYQTNLTSTAFAADTPFDIDDYVVIEDFATSTLDSLPSGWSWRGKDNDKPKLYAVRATNGQRYLAAQDTGLSVALFKRANWNPQHYPIMTWCWRANDLPPGADERYTETNDSAAGVYVMVSKTFLLGIPRMIKYAWSTTLAKGTIGRRKGIGRPWVIVLESGPEKLGQWVFEEIDLARDHKLTFKRDLPNKIIAIAVLTDANQTRSYAEAAYADFRAWPKAALGHIPNYCASLASK